MHGMKSFATHVASQGKISLKLFIALCCSNTKTNVCCSNTTTYFGKREVSYMFRLKFKPYSTCV